MMSHEAASRREHLGDHGDQETRHFDGCVPEPRGKSGARRQSRWRCRPLTRASTTGSEPTLSSSMTGAVSTTSSSDRTLRTGRGHDGRHRHRLVLTSAPSLQGYVLVGLSLGAREGGRDLAHLAREASQKVVKAQHPHQVAVSVDERQSSNAHGPA
jgi:hypothetical protein